MRAEIAIPLLAVAVAVLGAACSDSSSDEDGGSEADTDCQADGGADGGCGAEPFGCEDIADDIDDQYVGCCWCGTVYWCDESTMNAIDCGLNGDECAYNAAAGFMDCMH